MDLPCLCPFSQALQKGRTAMAIYQGYQQWSSPQATALCLGVFDSVHLGHQALIQATKHLAQIHQCQALAYTFTPHPAVLLSPKLAPHMLEPQAVRCHRLLQAELDGVLLQPFTREFANLSAQAFVVDILVAILKVKAIIIGQGFTFGKDQGGHVELLTALGATHGFEVHAIPPVRQQGLHISSSKIREFVGAGKVEGAAMLLGRRYGYFGTVRQGAQRGRSLGFPTANLDGGGCKLPENGVYAAYAHLGDLPIPAIVNVGSAPTFVANQPSQVEVHLFEDPSDELYGKPMAVSLLKKIRSEHRFSGKEALIAQIRQDIEQARTLQQSWDNSPLCWPDKLPLPQLS